jgi:hypothetical protein
VTAARAFYIGSTVLALGVGALQMFDPNVPRAAGLE